MPVLTRNMGHTELLDEHNTGSLFVFYSSTNRYGTNLTEILYIFNLLTKSVYCFHKKDSLFAQIMNSRPPSFMN
jgi:hypothetical protein